MLPSCKHAALPLPIPSLPSLLPRPLNFIDKRRGTHRRKERKKKTHTLLGGEGDLCWLKGNTHFYGQFGFYVNLLLLPSVNMYMYRAIQAVAHSQFQYQCSPRLPSHPSHPCQVAHIKNGRYGARQRFQFCLIGQTGERRRGRAGRRMKTAGTMTATRCCDNCQQQQQQLSLLLTPLSTAYLPLGGTLRL